MAQAVGVQLHCGLLSSLFVQATSEFLLNTYGGPSASLAKCITLACSCQKPLYSLSCRRQVRIKLYYLPCCSSLSGKTLNARSLHHHQPCSISQIQSRLGLENDSNSFCPHAE